MNVIWLLSFFTALFLLAAPSFSHPVVLPPEIDTSLPDVQALFEGNDRFVNRMDSKFPGLLKKLAREPQGKSLSFKSDTKAEYTPFSSSAPGFLFFGCSDSRTSEGTLFDALPGTLFVQRNVANLYDESDLNSNAVLSYAVMHLGVTHIIVMGHYGCGGVAAAITNPMTARDDFNPAQRWIIPIKELYATSNRSEIVELRSRNKGKRPVPMPPLRNAGYRALVEENIKANVLRIQHASLFSFGHSPNVGIRSPSAHASCHEGSSDEEDENCMSERIVVHGWVYDLETGRVVDLGVSASLGDIAVPIAPACEGRHCDRDLGGTFISQLPL
ncbi:hypothetical protein HGRIS_001671 [Hohenbuehelia grisea]|uniref:Carbonic anhydrase n=1 Tax=Hohenbuehelia grisea TaxID=104357 RepID=A0ABR3JIX5_9AGAR